MDFAEFVTLGLRMLPRPFSSAGPVAARMREEEDSLLRNSFLLSVFGVLAFSTASSLAEWKDGGTVLSAAVLLPVFLLFNYLGDLFLLSWVNLLLSVGGKKADGKEMLGLFFLAEFPLFVALPAAFVFLLLPVSFVPVFRFFLLFLSIWVFAIKVNAVSVSSGISRWKSLLLLAAPVLALIIFALGLAVLALGSLTGLMAAGVPA
jgi:hypothetical protein